MTECVSKHPWKGKMYCVVITGIKTVMPAGHRCSVLTPSLHKAELCCFPGSIICTPGTHVQSKTWCKATHGRVCLLTWEQ